MKRLILSCILMLMSFIFANAQVPQLINYQAILTDTEDNPVNGTRSIQFSIYDAETDGTEMWTETQEILIEDGLLSVLLGSINPIPYSIFEGDETYLELKIGSDPAMTPRKRLVSVGYAMRANYADHVSGLANDFVETVDGVAADGSGNIDLVEGDNITIEPQPGSNQITISAAGGGTTGDNLGNHRATQNIRLNDHWLSNDGDDEGIQIGNSGNLLITDDINCHGNIYVVNDIQANNDITAINNVTAHTVEGNVWVLGENIQSQEDVRAVDGYVITGWPSTTFGNGDICATDEVIADNIIRTGSPSVSYSSGDIVASGSLVSDNIVRTGSPSVTSYGSGDIAATDDLICDGDGYIGDNLRVWNHAGINAGGGYNTTYPLYVYGNAYSTGSWLGSDIKFKKNVVNIENPLSKLQSLNGVSFNWKTDEYPEREFSEGQHFGLIAQEVEKVLPEIVMTDENGEKAVLKTQGVI